MGGGGGTIPWGGGVATRDTEPYIYMDIFGGSLGLNLVAKHQLHMFTLSVHFFRGENQKL